jgi:hypothetical protein
MFSSSPATQALRAGPTCWRLLAAAVSCDAVDLADSCVFSVVGLLGIVGLILGSTVTGVYSV